MLFRANCILAALANLIAVGCLATTSIAGPDWGIGRTALIAVLFFSGATAVAGGFHKSGASTAV
jgi:hypothetical protein